MKARVIVATMVVFVALLLQTVDAGFGCPGNQYKCNRHCKSIGCRGGYCDIATLYFRCTCVRCRHLEEEFFTE